MKKKSGILMLIVLLFLLVITLVACSTEKIAVITAQDRVVEFSGNSEGIEPATLNVFGGLQYHYKGIDNDYSEIYPPYNPGEYEVSILYPGGKHIDAVEKKVKLTITMPFELDKIGTTLTKYIGSKTNVAIPESYKNKNIIAVDSEIFKSSTQMEILSVGKNIQTFDADVLQGLSACKKIIATGQTKFTGVFSGIELEYKNIKEAPAEMINAQGIDILKLPLSLTTLKSNAIENSTIKELHIQGNVELAEVIFPVSLKKVVVFDSTASIPILTGDGYTTGETEKYIIKDFLNNFENIEEVIIGDKISQIENGAFANCTSLNTVTLGKSYRNVIDEGLSDVIPFFNTDVQTLYIRGNAGNYLFFPDTLKKIVLMETVERLEIRFPKSVEEIEFSSNATFKEIPESYFSWLPLLERVELPSSIETIGKSAFYGCTSLTNITLPNGLKNIGEMAFQESGLKSIVLPPSLTSLSNQVFYYSDLESITIPSTLISIGSAVFGRTALKSVTIPSTLTSIGLNAFLAESLIEINVDQDNPNYSSIDGVFFNKDKTELILYPESKLGNDYQIPASVKNIGTRAFLRTKFKNVTFEKGSQLEIIGEMAFRHSNLVSIKIPVSTIEIMEEAFENCYDLEIVTFDEGSKLKIIGERAFNQNHKLKSIIIPDTVEIAGRSAFGFIWDSIVYAKSQSKPTGWDDSATDYTRTYWYSETQPTSTPETGAGYWKYAEDGMTPVIWTIA